MSKKHAYLIIAHTNPFVLEKLIQMIDDVRNDIYIHIDKKSTLDIQYYKKLVSKSNLVFVTPRLDVRWGDISQIEVELKLYKTAFQTSSYSYYHLISGGDLPIKSQDYIHGFFDKNEGKEFIGFSNGYFDKERVEKHQILLRPYAKAKSRYTKYIIKQSRKFVFSLQSFLGYNKTRKTELEFVFGSNWASLTHNLVKDLLEQESWFLQFYKHAYCADEIYKQTFVYNSKYRAKVYDSNNELKSNLRLIDWHRGSPYIFRLEDFNEIMNSDRIFARKFDDNVDKVIVEKIYEALNDNGN